MTVVEHSDWNLEALMEKIVCPCCGNDVWENMGPHGYSCQNCWCLVDDIRLPGGDSGYIVSFDGSEMQADKAENAFPEDAAVSAKFLGMNDPELHWFSARNPETGDEYDWDPILKEGTKCIA